MADLRRRVVAFLEGRRSAEFGDLIERHGGVPYSVPCLQEVHHPDAPELVAAVDRLCRDDVQAAVFLTGVGTSTILEAARLVGRERELLQALERKQIAVRGPKPTAVLRRAGVRIDLTAPAPHTSGELLEAMKAWDVLGKTVAVQLYGGPNPELCDGLARRGARVLEISPYAWERPRDAGLVLRLIDDLESGKVDALVATSAAQVDNLFAIAREHGREAALRQGLAQIPVAAQGPVCSAAFEREGVPVAIVPPHGHMGSLVLAMAGYFDSLALMPPDLSGGGSPGRQVPNSFGPPGESPPTQVGARTRGDAPQAKARGIPGGGRRRSGRSSERLGRTRDVHDVRLSERR